MTGGTEPVAALPPDAVWLQMSTLGEAGTQRCAGLATAHGIAFVDAPVLGTRQPAEERKLVVLASGPAGLRERVQPVLDAVGQKTMWVGETGAGTRLKLVTNSWVLAVVEAGAETIAQQLGEGARQHGDEDMAATYLTSAPGRAA